MVFRDKNTIFVANYYEYKFCHTEIVIKNGRKNQNEQDKRHLYANSHANALHFCHSDIFLRFCHYLSPDGHRLVLRHGQRALSIQCNNHLFFDFLRCVCHENNFFTVAQQTAFHTRLVHSLVRARISAYRSYYHPVHLVHI